MIIRVRYFNGPRAWPNIYGLGRELFHVEPVKMTKEMMRRLMQRAKQFQNENIGGTETRH